VLQTKEKTHKLISHSLLVIMFLSEKTVQEYKNTISKINHKDKPMFFIEYWEEQLKKIKKDIRGQQ
jgi:hypothetical protein